MVDPSAMTEAGDAGAAGGAASELGPGASVGKYRLERVLGAGGMGVVWAAFDPDLERAVAIKLLRSIDSVAALRTRLLREARAMARLKHPNILTVYEVGTDRNRDYIAMELIEGADLDHWLATRPPRSEILAALLAAGRGLAAAHDAGLIHRDLKPHNILRGRDGSVYVTDFGLARGQIDDGEQVVQVPLAVAATEIMSDSRPRGLDSVLDSPLTQTGVLIGTPAYMAPEQFAGRAPDPRSDQFAFCVTAWEALTGSRPFAGKTLDELRAAASAGVQGDGGLSPVIRGVLARGLAPDPAARWPDMHAVLRALEQAIAPRPRSRMRWIAAALIVAAIAAGGIAALGLGRARALAGQCEPADEAFASAWPAERRKVVLEASKSRVTLAATVAMLDELRRDWIRAYQLTCAMPSSQQRNERIACLLETRDQIAETTSELEEDGSDISLGAVVALNVALGLCKANDPGEPSGPRAPRPPLPPPPPPSPRRGLP